MKSVYEKIDKMYEKRADDEPVWVDELRGELKEIKFLLKSIKQQSPRRKQKKSQAYFDFVKRFRDALMADTTKGIYPEVHYKGRRIGVNIKGFLYDKATTQSLKAQEAFVLYEFFYAKNKPLESFIIMD